MCTSKPFSRELSFEIPTCDRGHAILIAHLIPRIFGCGIECLGFWVSEALPFGPQLRNRLGQPHEVAVDNHLWVWGFEFGVWGLGFRVWGLGLGF